MEQLTDIIFELSDKIWDYAEVDFDTKKSCDAFVEILEKYNFKIERPFVTLEHGFKATWGNASPAIGFLVEYDALHGLSQKAHIDYKESNPAQDAGHACGHNLLGSAVLLSALKLQNYLKKHQLDGSVIVYGCPAEEKGYGKSIIAKHKGFDDSDVLLTWHPSNQTSLWQDKTLAVNTYIFNFKGVSTHAAFSPEKGRSALKASELMNIGANYLREHTPDDVRIHYAYLDSGNISPNVVQDKTSLHYYVRAFDQVVLKDISNRLIDVAKGAAIMTQTQMDYTFESSCKPLLPNETLSKVMYQSLEKYLPLQYTEEAVTFAKTLSENKISPINCELQPYEINKLSYISTDVGDASYQVPTCQFFMACEPRDSEMHSWKWTANGKSVFAHEGIVYAANILFDTAQKLIKNPKIIEQAQRELYSKRKSDLSLR